MLAMEDGRVVHRLRAEVFPEPGLGARYNIAPTQPIAIARERYDDGVRELCHARWGLVPSWAKDPSIGGRMINARSETVVEKPAFRSAASKRRCLIPASGYYEWMPVTGSKTKQPIYLHADHDDLLAFAGLYEQWWPKARPDAEPLWTATIITTAAPDALGQIHDRTPVILPENLWDDWLSPRITEKVDIAGILAAVPEPRLVPRLVGPAVGNVRSQGPSLIESVSS